jgi:glycosyltransferase involved in cell wall biosynthesis
MQVIHIVPGTGGSFYCGNCLRDSTYVQALRKEGIDALKIPMYLPIFSDEHDLTDIPVFYGAISLYLKHKYPILRKAPAWFDKVLNSGLALKFAAKMSGSTRAKGLEDMTISMLLGELGGQKEELDKMVDWIAEHCEADVIHLSNALLIGLARRFQEKLDVLVVCSLQDEDVWVNAMDDHFKKKTWGLMSERANDVDAFIAVSDFYAGVMKEQMNIASEKLYSSYISVDPEDYSYINSSEKAFTIGYISRMCEENGLEVLVDAFILFKKKPGKDNVKLILTGGSTGDDQDFLKMIKNKISEAGISEDVVYHKDFENEGRHEFFSKVSLISVPVLEGEAFGMYLLEAMASGVAVVQPALGAFPEIVGISEGGIIFQPNKPEELAKALDDLHMDPDKLSSLSEKGREGITRHFSIHDQASRMMKFYKQIKTNKKQ